MFFKKYRQEHNIDALYDAFVSEFMKIFNIDINYFLEKDPNFEWRHYMLTEDNDVNLNIASNVTKIPSYAFYDCWPLTSVFIPDSVITIGRGAFYDCNHLTIVYCEAASKPSGWDVEWEPSCPVVWGYKKK